MKIKFTVVFMLLNFFIFGQNEDLPIGFGVGEREKMPVYLEGLGISGITTPPATIPRTPAEWEEMDAMVIAWKSYPAVLAEIVRYAREECRVIIICTDVNTVKTYLTGVNVDFSSNVEFVVGSYNSVWMRDYGANPVYLKGVDDLALVDWIYNRPRPLDDKIPDLVGTYMNIPVYSTTAVPNDLVHTGGNFMSDGMGTGFSSKLVFEENGPNNTYGFSNQSEEDIDSIMYKFMGISNYIKMDNLPYDGIHHIDMHMKLLDEQTLIVGQYPTGTADGPQIEANLQYVLNNYTTKQGTPFRVIRVAMPADKSGKYPNQGGDYRTYANALIVNKSVLLPTYEMKFDTTAINIWKQAMPGYKIRSINCDGMISASGAIHCITKEVGVKEPLLIQHFSLSDVEGSFPVGYPVDAHIQHKSGIAAATIFYRIKGSTEWLSIPMMLGDFTLTEFFGFIPEQKNGTVIEYYIEGNSNSGKVQHKPITAPEGFYTFKVTNTTASYDLTTVSYIGEIFPNPAVSLTCIPVFCGSSQHLNVTLLDIFGNSKMTIFDGNKPKGEHKLFFDAGNLPAGTFFVKVEGKEGREVKMVVIQ